MKTRPVAILGVSLFLVACGTLPTMERVEKDVHRDHPDYTIVSSRYRIEGSYEARRRLNEAVFQIDYRKPNDTQLYTQKRRFGAVAEGWIEASAQAESTK